MSLTMIGTTAGGMGICKVVNKQMNEFAVKIAKFLLTQIK